MVKFLVYIVILLAVIVIARIVRIVELTSELSGESETESDKKDNKFNGGMMIFFLIATIAFFIGVTLHYKKYLLPVSASEHGVSIDLMLNVTFVIITIVFF